MGREFTQLARAVPKPHVYRKTLNIIAPIITNMTKQVVRAELISSSYRTDFVNRRLSTTINKAPEAPIAPASDGEKIPKYKPPIIRKKSASIPQIPDSETILFLQEKCSPGGPNWGFILHIMNIRAIYNDESIKPGKMPAMNNTPIDVW